MPWNEDCYPPAMERLPPPVRAKAIELANALLAEGREYGQVAARLRQMADALSAQGGNS